MELTIEDIDTLLEAMDDWQSSDVTTGLTVSMMGLMLGSSENKEDRQNEFKKTMEESSAKAKKEISIMLKAKLISMKQELAIKKLEKV